MNIDHTETRRAEAEVMRQERETARQSAELVRKSAELARTGAEQTRADAEAVRRRTINELQTTVAALSVLIERMEKVEAMRRAAGRQN